MIKISYDMTPDGTVKGVGMEADCILDALVLAGWLRKQGYYNVTFDRKEEENA